MLWVISNQLAVITMASVLGALTVIGLLYSQATVKTWRVADLIWIIIGGFGALTAFIVSLYLSDIGNTQRAIDLTRTKISSLNADASHARSRYCTDLDRGQVLPDFATDYSNICDAIRSIAALTADDSEAYDLIGLLESQNPQVTKNDSTLDWENIKVPEALEGELSEHTRMQASPTLSNELLKFMSAGKFAGGYFTIDVHSPALAASQLNLASTGIYSGIASEFRALKENLTIVTQQFDRLRVIWASLLEQRWLLLIRTLALAMLAFCLPLRIGKSVSEIIRN